MTDKEKEEDNPITTVVHEKPLDISFTKGKVTSCFPPLDISSLVVDLKIPSLIRVLEWLSEEGYTDIHFEGCHPSITIVGDLKIPSLIIVCEWLAEARYTSIHFADCNPSIIVYK